MADLVLVKSLRAPPPPPPPTMKHCSVSYLNNIKIAPRAILAFDGSIDNREGGGIETHVYPVMYVDLDISASRSCDFIKVRDWHKTTSRQPFQAFAMASYMHIT